MLKYLLTVRNPISKRIFFFLFAEVIYVQFTLLPRLKKHVFEFRAVGTSIGRRKLAFLWSAKFMKMYIFGNFYFFYNFTVYTLCIFWKKKLTTIDLQLFKTTINIILEILFGYIRINCEKVDNRPNLLTVYSERVGVCCYE